MPPNSPKNPSRPTVYLTPETLALLQSAAPRGFSMSGRINAVTNRYHAATTDTLARIPDYKITKVGDTYVGVEIADNVEIQLQKPAVAMVLPKGTLKAI